MIIGYEWFIGRNESSATPLITSHLDSLMHAFERAPDLPNLLVDADIRALVAGTERGWRSTASAGVAAGIPLPAMTAALSYFDGYRTARLPQNLTQAQRDYFGAHTYQRVDRPEAGFVHTDWASFTGETAPASFHDKKPAG